MSKIGEKISQFKAWFGHLFKWPMKRQPANPEGVNPGTPPSSAPTSRNENNTLTNLLKLTKKSLKQGPKASLQNSLFAIMSASSVSFENGLQQKHITRLALLVWVPLLAYATAGFLAGLLDPYLPSSKSQASTKRMSAKSFQPRSLADDQIIVSRNLFNSKGLIPGENKGGFDQNNVPIRTSLPITLIGTLVLTNKLRSIGTIQDNSDRQVFPMRASDEIPGKLRILEVESNRVVFLNLGSGLREFVDIPEKEGTNLGISVARPRAAPSLESTAENALQKNFTIPRTEVDKATENLPLLLTQVLAREHRESGVFVGFKLTQIQPGSIFAKLGIIEGDILCGVNGEPVADVTKAWELFGTLKSASKVELCIKRNGKEMSYNYDLK